MIIRRRPALLLEVIIAFALVVLCALPLIYPHVFIFRSEKQFASTLDLDHSVNLFFVELLRKLYQNEIPWSMIEEEKLIPIDDASIPEVDQEKLLPYTGSYRFELVKKKISADGKHSAYIYNIVMLFTPKQGTKPNKTAVPQRYRYTVALERKLS